MALYGQARAEFLGAAITDAVKQVEVVVLPGLASLHGDGGTGSEAREQQPRKDADGSGLGDGGEAEGHEFNPRRSLLSAIAKIRPVERARRHAVVKQRVLQRDPNLLFSEQAAEILVKRVKCLKTQ
ncbi:hypothetical protein FVE85_3175 [Porphyridium purpureum]|uniref:Uncharacterized protein n=1 Tax=Porphyridium purpureum TaxID=35688 RepID=A0A5J4YW40_PORPP|nr:hypothetical protein FVE85_3175 [Porphyridium purpureum]|eukprot:POR8648..scf227_4